MNRRKFLGFLAISPLAKKVVPEVVKGVDWGAEKAYSVITNYDVPNRTITFSRILEKELELVSTRIPELFDRDDTFFRYIKDKK